MYSVTGHSVTDHIVWELTPREGKTSAKERLQRRTGGEKLEALVVHCREGHVHHQERQHRPCTMCAVSLVLMDGAFNLFAAHLEPTLLHALPQWDKKVQPGWRVTISDYEVMEKPGSHNAQPSTWVIVNACSFKRQREHFCGAERARLLTLKNFGIGSGAPCCFEVSREVVGRVLRGELVTNVEEGRAGPEIVSHIVAESPDVKFRYGEGLEMHLRCPVRPTARGKKMTLCPCGIVGGYRTCLTEMYPPEKVNSELLFRIFRGHPRFRLFTYYDGLPFCEKLLLYNMGYSMVAPGLPKLRRIPMCVERGITQYVLGNPTASVVTPLKSKC